jgi:hypothetical protein
MADHDYKTGGLRQKYNVTKLSGEPIDDGAVYFVLRIDEDPTRTPEKRCANMRKALLVKMTF